MNPTDERAEHLDELRGLLWPPPAQTRLSSRPETGSGWDRQIIVIPNQKRPRMLVPAGRRASATALRQYGEPGSLTARVATRALAAALAGGMGPLLGDRLTVTEPPGAATIESYLTGLLGQRVDIAMHLGAARANRKPVLHLLTPAGATVGFAKIGVNDLTSDLVRAERAALDRLSSADAAGFRRPAVLAEGTWRTHPVLVLSPLPVWRRRVPLRPERLAGALTAIAGIAGVHEAPLTGHRYWRELLRRADRLEPTADARALRGLLGTLTNALGNVVIRFGSWHGDLTPWNMANTTDDLLVWDWERFATSVPAGFDALHYWLQSQVVSARREPAGAAAECARRSARLLAPFGAAPEQATVTALAYLAELSTRYLTDRQAEVSPLLGAPGRWLLPALRAEAERL